MPKSAPDKPALPRELTPRNKATLQKLKLYLRLNVMGCIIRPRNLEELPIVKCC